MKTSPLDFILSGISMGVLWLASWSISFYPIADFLFDKTPRYAGVITILICLNCYGILSGLLIRVTLWIKPIGLGPLKSDSSDFTYWKFLTMLHFFGQRALFLFNVAPAQPLLARLFGAKVGSNVAIGGFLDSPFLISVGDHCIIGNGSIISGNVHLSGTTSIGAVSIGPHTTIGVYSMVMPDTEIGAGATIAPNSVVVSGTRIPAGETWKGNPARKWQ